MWTTLLRFMWRIIIFALGVSIAYATVFLVFPFFNDKLPLLVAILVIYCLLAYFAIPALIRLWRLVFKPNHIPVYATTGDGWPSDPVNIAVVANGKRHLITAMKSAGWYVADKATIRNAFRELLSILFRKPYPTAPFSNLYLFGRPQDIGFQIPSNDRLSAYSRHHVRFWRLEPPESDRHNGHYHYWIRTFKHLVGAEKEVWIGAAIEDTHPLGIKWRSGQITHRTSSDINSERDFIIKTLKTDDQTKTISTVKAGEPFQMRGQQFDSKFISDGTLRVIELRNPIVTALRKKYIEQDD